MVAGFPPWTAHPAGDPLVVAALTAFVAVASTAVAFSLSLASLSRITPTEFAVTSTLEPALAAAAAAAFLGVTLRPPQYAGGALTIIAVLLLAPRRPLTSVPVGHAGGGAARATYLEARG